MVDSSFSVVRFAYTSTVRRPRWGLVYTPKAPSETTPNSSNDTKPLPIALCRAIPYTGRSRRRGVGRTAARRGRDGLVARLESVWEVSCFRGRSRRDKDMAQNVSGVEVELMSVGQIRIVCSRKYCIPPHMVARSSPSHGPREKVWGF